MLSSLTVNRQLLTGSNNNAHHIIIVIIVSINIFIETNSTYHPHSQLLLVVEQ